MQSCDACLKPSQPHELTFTAQGQQLCRSCYGKYQTMMATKQARSADLFRRCTCGNVLGPYADRSKDDEGLAFSPSHYQCGRCGKSFLVLSSLSLVLLAVGLGVGAFLGGQALWGGDVPGTLLAGVFVLGTGATMARELLNRVRHPRVR